MILTTISQVLLVAFAGLMAWAAASDARELRIPNRIPSAVAGLWMPYAACRLLEDVPVGAIAMAAALALAAFAVGTLLFARRLLGGGDVKLLAAAALWAGPQLIVPFVLVTLLAGGALGLVVFAARLTRDLVLSPPSGAATLRAPVVVSNALKGTIPFGVAIAAGGLFVAGRLLFGPLSFGPLNFAL